MDVSEHRLRAAQLLRQLGHEFVGRNPNDTQLDELITQLDQLLALVRGAARRTREAPAADFSKFILEVPSRDAPVVHHLFADSIVSGGANPMGLGAQLWRDGDTAVMQVTLGDAFEGAPGRAHGGILAALLDETMGLVNAINGILAFTVQLDITYLAPAPVNVPITARASMVSRDDRKVRIEGTVSANGTAIARASSLFITVDPTTFLDQTVPEEP